MSDLFGNHNVGFPTRQLILKFQSQVIEFQWSDIKAYDVEEEGMSFAFEYNRPGKKPRMVQILTQYVSHTPLLHLSLDERKTVIRVSNQLRHKHSVQSQNNFRTLNRDCTDFVVKTKALISSADTTPSYLFPVLV